MMANKSELLKGMKVIKAMNLARNISSTILEENTNILDATRKQVIAKHGLTYLRDPIIMLFICVGLFVSLEALGLIGSELLLIIVIIFIRISQTLGKFQSDYQTFSVNEPFYKSFRNKN